MSRPVKILKLSEEDKRLLEEGYKYSPKASYSRRCHIILLKSKEHSSQQIADIFGITDQSVNNWVKRFEGNGLEGLQTKTGQGRPRIFDKTEDAEKVKKIVKTERQRLKLAKAELENELGKEFSMKTLNRFLKLLAAPTNASV